MMSKEMHDRLKNATYVIGGHEVSSGSLEFKRFEPSEAVNERVERLVNPLRLTFTIAISGEGAKALSSMVNAIIEREQHKREQEVQQQLLKELLKTGASEFTCLDTEYGESFIVRRDDLIKIAKEFNESIERMTSAFGAGLGSAYQQILADPLSELREICSELYREEIDCKNHTEAHDRRYANKAALRSIKGSRRPELKIKGYRHLYKNRR